MTARALFDALWPIDRSLTGDGVRKTHRLLAEVAGGDGVRKTHRLLAEVAGGMTAVEVPSGTKVFDWTVPQEWRLHRARVALLGHGARVVIDTAWSPLHVVGYSAPFEGTVTWAELQDHLHVGESGNAIPYRTRYYGSRTWGLCLSWRQWRALEAEVSRMSEPPLCHVVVETELFDGSLTLGEVVLPATAHHPDVDPIEATSTREILFSAYTCHPGMARNELIGPILQALLCKAVRAMPARRLNYRFVWGAETIGALCHLSRFGLRIDRIEAGFALSCLGGAFLLAKSSRRGGTLADRAAAAILGTPCESWVPTGSDERQYCSPGFDLPLVSLHGEAYAEYHTSADTAEIVDWPGVERDLNRLVALVELLERNRCYRRCDGGLGEPFLSRHGLRDPLGGPNRGGERKAAIEWVLSLCEPGVDLLAVSERSGMGFGAIYDAAKECQKAGLLGAC